MSGKVVHLDSEIHAEAKAYCEKHGIRMKDFVETLIADGVKKVSRLQPVGRKRLESLAEDIDGTPVWQRPPFWAGALEPQNVNRICRSGHTYVTADSVVGKCWCGQPPILSVIRTEEKTDGD